MIVDVTSKSFEFESEVRMKKENQEKMTSILN